MSKIALVTGGTDGLGRATALYLAQNGFSVHILGRNPARGSQVCQQLVVLNPSGDHYFYKCDLSSKVEVTNFLDSYLEGQNRLDILILNAGVHLKTPKLSADGIDLAFSVGFVSRYLFSVRLQPLLTLSKMACVVHVCGSLNGPFGKPLGKIRYATLQKPKYGMLAGVWQNALASALLVYHWKKKSKSTVHHLHWNPGIVNTQTVKTQPKFMQKLSQYFGMLEPEQAAQIMVDAILNRPLNQFYSKGKEYQKVPDYVKSIQQFEKLIQYSESFTRVDLPNSELE